MATRHVHRPSSPASVALDFDLPASLLASAPAEVRDLRTAYTEAETALQAALDEVVTPAEVLGDNASAIKAAVNAGRKVPQVVSAPEAEARAALSVAKANDAARVAYKTATAFEASLIAHRSAIREALSPAFREADEEAQEARRIASEKEARRGMILAVFATLDNAVALADDIAAVERTHRHRNALAAERRERADEATQVSADLLESDNYVTARKGQAHYDVVRQARAELQTIRNGDRRFLTYADRARAEAALVVQLRGLGVRA
jgi:hypothetical protein